MPGDNCYLNGSKCKDPTAGKAIAKNAAGDAGQKRVTRLIKTIINICSLAGYELIGWIDVVDQKTSIRYREKIFKSKG